MLEWKNLGRHNQRMMEVLNLVFLNHEKLLQFLFEIERPVLRQEPEALLNSACGFSSGEQVLIRVGLDLWNGTGSVRLWDLIDLLDDETYFNVLKGLYHLRYFEDENEVIIWRQPKMAY
jgi:hypothetical protein